MGSHVHMHARAKGNVTDRGIFSTPIEPRIGFAKGWLTGGTDPADGSVECGDGTEYPLAVTADQLCEIMYRVRDVKITSGSFSGNFTRTVNVFDYSGSFASTFHDGTRPTELLLEPTATPYTNIYGSSVSGDFKLMRGNQGYPGADLPSTFYDSDYGGEFGGLYTTGTGIDARDAITELALWRNTSSFSTRFLPSGMSMESLLGFSESTTNIGSSFHGSTLSASISSVRNDGSSGGEISYNYYSGASTILGIENNVAFIDTAGNGNPFHPDNTIYIKLEAFLRSSFLHSSLSSTLISVSTKQNSASSIRVNRDPTGGSLTINLSGGDSVSCPLYWDITAFSTNHPAFTGLESSDLIFTATKWWPYDDGKGNPVWDENTGAKINQP